MKKLKKGHALVLRTCDAERRGHGGFQWPESGPVEAPDWSPEPECGHGLHGWLWGEGDGDLGDWSPSARWLVVDVVEADCVDLGGHVKFPRGEVVCCGDRATATAYLAERAHGRAIIGGTSTSGAYGTSTSGDRGTSTSGAYGTSTSGDGGTSTSGDGGTSTSGDHGTSTSGYRGTSTSGDRGTSTSGAYGTSTSGDGGTSTSGDGGTSTSGDHGTSTSGYRGTSTSGAWGTSTSGDRGTSTSGAYGTSTSGYGGTSTSGYGGTIVLFWWDYAVGHRRLVVGYIGEDGLEPGVRYRLDAEHRIVPAVAP